MKGLKRIPTNDDLAQAYDQLLIDRVPALSEFALWTQWTRFDPRLGEQVLGLMARHWKQMDPLLLREALFILPWPQTLGVLSEQALAANLIARSERPLFRKWMEMILTQVPPAPNEQFFIGLLKPGGKQMLLDSEFPLRSYAKWGYLGREVMINKAGAKLSKQNRTLLAPSVRKRALDRILNQRKRLTVEDYRMALGHQVSSRQAELDLSRDKRLVPVGQTKGRFYVVARTRGRAKVGS